MSPFIIYGSSVPALPELRTMLEPELVKRTLRRKPNDNPLIPGFISLVSADILTIDMGLGDPLARVKESIEAGEKVSLARLKKENLMNILSVAVRFHTKEEVKSFGGIQQLSPTRFFDMEHIWVFSRRLPSQKQMLEVKSNKEKIPNMPWRLARSVSFYPAHLQVDLRKSKDDEEEEEEEE